MVKTNKNMLRNERDIPNINPVFNFMEVASLLSILAETVLDMAISQPAVEIAANKATTGSII